MEPKSEAVAIIDPSNLRTMGEMLTFGEQIIQSKLTPLKTASDVVAALLTGRELGIPTMASVNNIHPIEGRSSLGIHLICAKLLSNGITYKVIKDYQPVFRVFIPVKDKEKNPDGSDKFTNVHVRNVFRDETGYAGEKIEKTPYDYKTVIEFRRKVKQADGTWVEMIIESDYSFRDAASAGYSEKDNWKKNGKIMTRTRCLTIGSRLIADDLLLGLMETGEALDVAGKDYEVDKSGEVIRVYDDTNRPAERKVADVSHIEEVTPEMVEPITEAVDLNSTENKETTDNNSPKEQTTEGTNVAEDNSSKETNSNNNP